MEILDYNIINNNIFDRTKSYFSVYYNSIILFTDYDAKSYNIATRYNTDTKKNEFYIILYKDIDAKGKIPISRDANTGFKIFIPSNISKILDSNLRNKIINSKEDFNVDVKFVEEREDFCIIYNINIE